jgi:hypothetical protein
MTHKGGISTHGGAIAGLLFVPYLALAESFV